MAEPLENGVNPCKSVSKQNKANIRGVCDDCIKF
jgi:hypothetical protein